MAIITRNGKSVLFKRIVVFGCSHAAGLELGDAMWVADKYTEDEVDAIKRELEKDGKNREFYQTILKDVTPWELEKKQKTLSWPNYVAEYYNVPLLNLGKGGASNEEIMYSIETTIDRGIVDLDNDLILISITSPNRFFMISDTCQPQSAIFDNSHGWPDDDAFRESMCKHLSNPHYSVWQTYSSLRHIDLLSSKYGERFIGVYGFCNTKHFVPATSEKTSRLLNAIDAMDFILDNELCLLHFNEYSDEANHGFWHPKIKYHKILANEVVQRLEHNTECQKEINLADTLTDEEKLIKRINELRRSDPFIYY